MPRKKSPKIPNRILQAGGYVDPKKYDDYGNIVYPSKLNKNIRIDNYLPAGGLIKDTITEIEKKIQSDMNDRMFELLDYYEIDRNSPRKWMFLAFSLACQHVPGLKFEKHHVKGGRTKVKTPAKDLELLLAFIETKKKFPADTSTMSVITHMFNKRIRDDLYKKCGTAQSLYSRFYEAKKRLEDKDYKQQALEEYVSKELSSR